MRWAFLFLLVAEFLLFDRMTSLHYAGIYPRWNDQIQPLAESYTGYDFLRANGFWRGVEHTLAKPAAQGEMHSLWAILVFEVSGRPSRSAALAVNMLAFLIWQTVLAYAVIRCSGSRPLAWIAVGLTLALRWPWSGIQASATDFRLDQVTMCMMGISLAAALLTNGFRNIGWSSIFGVAVGFTVLTRYLTATYFVVIFGVCLLWVLVSRERRIRALNLGLAAAVALVLIAPCFWLNRQEIYKHYWIGHYLDPDGVLWSSHLPFGRAFLRALELLCTKQLGAAFWLISGLSASVLACGLRSTARRVNTEEASVTMSVVAQTAILGLIFLLAPVMILALQNLDKAVVVVLGAAVPGAIVLILALCAALCTVSAMESDARHNAALSTLSAFLAVTLGTGYFVNRETAEPFNAAFAADIQQVNAAADQIFAAAHSNGIEQPRVAVDRVTDFLDGTVLPVICYERHRVWIPFIAELPSGLSATQESLVMDRLASSDFVFATEEGPSGPWPIDRELFSLRPKILAWCKEHLRFVQRFTISGLRMALYERPEIGMPPVFLSVPHLLGSTKEDFAFRLKIASGQAVYHSTLLPVGLILDGQSGWIHGQPTQVGPFTTTITATNSAGSTSKEFTFQFENSSLFAHVNAPSECAPGIPVEISFSAFDGMAKWNFIDVTDLTTKKLLGRLSAMDDNRQNWQGRYQATFSVAGAHIVNFRFVRFDPMEKNAYTFLDESVEIRVMEKPTAAK